MSEIWFEAESVKDFGGWIVDTQSMESIHSSYIMSHGMGVPVSDATGEFNVSHKGLYNVWALTRNWTAVWNVPIPAGQWQLKIDGKPFVETQGTLNGEWAWQKCGQIILGSGKHSIAFHDLTGFNGRCDAIYFSTDEKAPSNDVNEIERLRKRLNYIEITEDNTVYDLIIVGGGIAGICIALSALRSGVNALLIHDRGILGGCNSSEVRVCMGGVANLPPYENIGNVVKEIAPIMGAPNRFEAKYYEDERKEMAFEVSKATNALMLNYAVTAVDAKNGKINSIVVTDTLTGKKKRLYANNFVDSTGDAVLARKAGATVMYGREEKSKFNESLAPEKADKLVMGHSIRWHSESTENETDFPDIDWGLNFNENNYSDVFCGDWEQETGFRRNMVSEIEYIRDFGLRAIYSNWAYQKKNHKEKYADFRLKWVSPIGGKRESYRVVGDYVLTQNDIEGHIEQADATAPMTWSIDMHFPEIDNDAEFDEPFRSFAYHRGIEKPYHVPYRCLYSRDVENLFLGGRLVSASHVAFSSIRVMRTLGQLGEVVGLASAVCKKYNCTPRQVYAEHLDELKDMMKRGVKIPSAFCCSVGNEECYHFNDIGWLNLHPYSCDERYIEKFKRGIKKLNIEHKYDIPDKLL